MAESEVCLLAEKIGVFLEENKSKLPRGAIQDAEFIKAELERMSVVLRLAETVEHDFDVLINKTVELAFDIEDIIDEFKSPVATHPMKFFKSKLTRLIRGIKHESLASKMLSIISRITDLSVELQRFKLEVVNDASSSGSWHEKRVDMNLQSVDAEAVGIDNPKRQLLEWLTDEDPSFKVISVVGMAGLGKTTLVKKVYEEIAVFNHFDIHGWITVSQFRLEEFFRDMIQQIRSFYGQTIPEGIETMGSHGLKEILKVILQGMRYLVVIDDVRDLYKWDAIKDALPLSDCGSRVLLTTCNRVIANMLSSDFEGRVYSLMPLSSGMSWQLFCARTFKHQECPADLIDVSRNIVSRCEGLPLAIVATANALSTKLDQGSSYRSALSNIDIFCSRLMGKESQLLHSFFSGLIGNRLLGESQLLHSYYDLPSHLKACLLYASLFPAYQINCAELFRLWMAEGFVKKEDGKTEEQVANGYLNELVNRSLIQVSSFDLAEDGSIFECRIHGILREVILSKCRIERFASLIDVDRCTKWPKEARRICFRRAEWPKEARRLCFPSFLKFLRSFQKRRLRTLLNLSYGSRSISRYILTSLLTGSLKQLKVLHLKSFHFESFPEIITQLYNLKYLSLTGSEIDIIPSSIGKLRNLETLDLANTPITRLPPTIKNLQRLRYLSAFRLTRGYHSALPRRSGFEAISGLGCLHSLQELWYIELNQEKYGNNLIENLGELRQLKKLGITKLKRKDSSAIHSLIEKLTGLNRLEIDFQETIDLQDISSPPHFLQWINLQGRVERLPNWITSLSNLAVLKLQGSRLRNNVLEAIQALPSLVHLELVEAFDGNKLLFEDGGFQTLKRLHLENLQGLQEVVVEKGSMVCLEKLQIDYCPILENVPSGIENLAELKDLKLTGVSANLANKIDRTNGGEDSWRIEHVKEVRIIPLWLQR